MASRKTRTLLTTLGIAVGVATAVAVFVLDYNTLITLKIKEITAYGTPDLEVSTAAGDPASFAADLARLRSKSYVQRVTPLFFGTLSILRPDGSEAIAVAGLEQDASGWFGGYHVSAGHDLPDSGGHVIILTERVSARLGIGIGDSVRFAERPDLAFRVIGLIPVWLLGQRNNGNVGIIPFWDGWRAFRSQAVSPFYWVKLNGTATVDAIRADLGPDHTVTLPPHVLAGETGDKKVMRDGVRVSGLLTLVLGLYLVFNSLSMALAERIREVGLMQAVGTTDRQIAAVFLVEACVMAVVGAAVGLIGGLVLTRLLMLFGFSSLGTGTRVWMFRLPRERLVQVVVLGVSAAMGGAVYPLLKARRLSVVEALKQRGLRLEIVLSRRLYALLVAALLIALPAGYMAAASALRIPWRQGLPLVVQTALLFAAFLSLIFLAPSLTGRLIRAISWPIKRLIRCEGFLVERTLSRSTARIAASLGILTFVFAALVGLKHMTMSLRLQSQRWVDPAVGGKLFVSSRLLSPAEYARLTAVPGVRAVVPMSHTIPAPFLIRGLPADGLRYGLFSRSPDLLRRFTSTPALLISSQLAHARGLKTGDRLTLSTNGGPMTFTILAVTDEYGYFIDERFFGVMNLATMTQAFRVETSAANQFVIVLDERADENRVKNELIAWYGGSFELSIITGGQKRAWVIGGVTSDFRIFDFILAMTCLLAGIGVTNALVIGALERRREFGLLQALGVTPAQLGRIVILEGTVVGLVGGVLGSGMGIPLARIIVDGLALVSQLDLTFTLSPRWLVMSVVAATAISTAAGLYPALKAVRVDVAESLQYE
ncbi:MAG: ABC transporter permease [Candidatus Latescibacteria bacterium]|nr:ABC transporter permease [Candidatus Latescibacterota bacterium]